MQAFDLGTYRAQPFSTFAGFLRFWSPDASTRTRSLWVMRLSAVVSCVALSLVSTVQVDYG
jgi:hypothetical protein